MEAIEQIKRSWKRLTPRNVTLATLYDLLFYLIVSGTVFIFAGFLNARTRNFDVDVFNTENIAKATEYYQSMLNTLVLLIIIYAIIFIIAWAIFKSLIWSELMGRKFNLHHLKNFTILSTIWLVIWGLILFLFPLLIREGLQGAVFLVLLAVFLHTSVVVYILFTKENLLRHSIHKGFSIAFGRIHHFIIPYLVIFALYYVVIVNVVFRILMLIPAERLVQGISIVITLVYVVWVRSYLIEVVR